MEHNVQYEYGVAFNELKKEAVKLHYQRYQEVGFFTKEDKDTYEQDSIYFIAKPQDRQHVAGLTRLINLPLHELPTIKEFHIYDIPKAKLEQLDRKKYAEISAFTKIPKHDCGLGLIKTALKYSQDTGITHWIGCIDERVYNYMHRMLKFPFQVIGEPKVYLGSKTIPCVLNLPECLDILKEKRKPLYDYFTTYHQEKIEVSK